MNMTKYFKNPLLLLAIGLVVFPSLVFAQEGGILPECGYDNNKNGVIEETELCHYSNLIEFANTAIDFIIKLALVVTPISFAYAGFIILTSGGDEGKLKKGKEILIKVGIGFAVILASYLFISFIMNTFVDPEAVVQILQRK